MHSSSISLMLSGGIQEVPTNFLQQANYLLSADGGKTF